MIAKTPEAPYYAVIFTSINTENVENYSEMAERMAELAHKQDGFLGIESARNEVGITVSYWKDLASIKSWKENAEHSLAQVQGRKKWYQSYKTRIAKVERDYGFEKEIFE
ncbi:antibiotic biosynthesis monooxygenase [Flavobacteriaceae bacterium]|nr:antibiotic biosynthesis monooxygenase [Flavobacteriaceae bacterium]